MPWRIVVKRKHIRGCPGHTFKFLGTERHRGWEPRWACRGIPIRCVLNESGCLGMQPKMGGKFHLKLNTGTRPIANKYREGKMKRTLKRELKGREAVKMEPFEASKGVLGFSLTRRGTAVISATVQSVRGPVWLCPGWDVLSWHSVSTWVWYVGEDWAEDSRWGSLCRCYSRPNW